MLITLENDYLHLTIDTHGAQMMSLVNDSTEYLWQGDSKYWSDRSPTLFPFIGRLWNNSYTYRGKTYHMGIHGFAATSDFAPIEQGNDYVVLSLSSNIASLVVYPFDFTLVITYRLVKNMVEITYTVRNGCGEIMPFGIGGHPGFRVPLSNGEAFEDYYLEFSAPCQPDRVGFTPDVYLSNVDTTYPLKDDRRIPLQHNLFDEDAIILKNMCREITLKSITGRRFLTVSYPQMNYLGIWHWPKTDAPYVCIEPWSSLPARQGVLEDFACKSDLIHLLPGKTYENTWTITIGEE